MAGFSSFIYAGDENVDPFGVNSSDKFDPFAKQPNDPFNIPPPTHPTINTFDDPFASNNTIPTSIPAPVVLEIPQETQKSPRTEHSIDFQDQNEEVEAVEVPKQGEAEEVDELKKEFKPIKSPRINIDMKEEEQNVPTIEIETKQIKEKNEKVEQSENKQEESEKKEITEVEDQADKRVIDYFNKNFTETFVPQLKTTESEVVDLIQIQGQLDAQLKVLYDKLKEMEKVLSPPTYTDDLERIAKVQKRIDRLNTLLGQIELRISTLINSRIYQKCLPLQFFHSTIFIFSLIFIVLI
ncbi:hypothetical protein EIN_311770 [Entamoeba invadens IP1]|uniref:Uncharacterized protein n=1 Tax=Entamoeba invadens IP1 TaxID=370355 RepID=A0A0A1TUT9_ENTIV|nr:hypothetical protein EIN_311770 [Entamoeba invadens IP1]ELP83916.1 hypothetical protein EIN_311770 [Entamoeba invadens IP1]|eukprot:XP_004183262.1 hypothetical protein EIN_311770 [Entamoeba invadens IP1]